jgi:hypothetical protein
VEASTPTETSAPSALAPPKYWLQPAEPVTRPLSAKTAVTRTSASASRPLIDVRRHVGPTSGDGTRVSFSSVTAVSFSGEDERSDSSLFPQPAAAVATMSAAQQDRDFNFDLRSK